MSFDQMYDEMLHGEFSSSGKHEGKATAIEAAPAVAPSAARGRHAASEPAERPSGFQRYRTAALVGAGGLACAAAGAFLGGLGGYFAISPAAAHAVGSPTITQDLPLAQAVSTAAHTSSGGVAKGTSAVMAADFSKVSGSLTQGIAPFATLTSEPLQNLPITGPVGIFGGSSGGLITSAVATGTVNGTGAGNNGTGGLSGCASSSDLGLTCILSSLSGALSNLGSLSASDPAGALNGLVPGLDGVVSDVTGTLQNLTSLLPIASLPLPTGSLPTSVLAGTSGTGGSPLGGVLPTGGLGSAGSNPVVGALAPVLNTVTSALGSGAPSIPSLPLPLPSTSGTGTTLPSLPLSGTPSSSTTDTSTSPSSTPSNSGSSSTGTSNTVNVPIPVPLPVSTPTISIGGLSVGINSSGSNSGLTLTLP